MQQKRRRGDGITHPYSSRDVIYEYAGENNNNDRKFLGNFRIVSRKTLAKRSFPMYLDYTQKLIIELWKMKN